MRVRKAFTLIELLVVIAIIAILAAILFPVFAQAKASAKAAASLSNIKQISLAALMYSGDFDDNTVVVGAWGSSDPDAWTSAGGWASWALLIDPYQKNMGINGSPLAGPLVRGSEIARRVGTRLQSYGYNYTYLSPSACCTWPTPITSISSTSVAQPANTVFFTESVSRDGTNPPAAVWWYGAGIGWMTTGTSEAPDCYTVPDVWCTDGWGVNSFWYNVIAQETEGRLTGRVAIRAANQIPVAYVDGHVKKNSSSGLAAGSNWTRTTLNSAIVNQDPEKYQWDTKQ